MRVLQQQERELRLAGGGEREVAIELVKVHLRRARTHERAVGATKPPGN
jgi:hypothetical protein